MAEDTMVLAEVENMGAVELTTMYSVEDGSARPDE